MSTERATVVLVHGAWADGSSWRKIITALNRDGTPVIAAPIPLTSLTDDVDAVDRAVARVGGPVVLVGHAYAGAVLGASRREQVRALVYVAALAPDEHETVADVFYRDAPHPNAPNLAPDADGYLWLPDEAFPRAFAQHADAEDQILLAATQRPIAVACIQEPVPAPRWKTLPTWYLRAEEDRMINAETQSFMADRMGARLRSHRTDHTPSITAPEAVLEVIAEAYAEVSAEPPAIDGEPAGTSGRR